MLVTIISSVACSVSTSAGPLPSYTKSDNGVTGLAVVLFITKNTYPCPDSRWNSVESFLVTVDLQRSFRSNKRFPCVATQWGTMVFSVSGYRIQRTSGLVYDNEIDLLVDFHAKAYLWERRIPVSRQFGLVIVKPSLPSSKVECVPIAPQVGIIVKGFLDKKDKEALIQCSYRFYVLKYIKLLCLKRN